MDGLDVDSEGEIHVEVPEIFEATEAFDKLEEELEEFTVF